MYRRLLHFGRYETTSRKNEIRIRLAIAILDVKSSKEDGSSRYWDLAEEKTFPELLNEVGEPYAQAV